MSRDFTFFTLLKELMGTAYNWEAFRAWNLIGKIVQCFVAINPFHDTHQQKNTTNQQNHSACTKKYQLLSFSSQK